MTTICLTLKFWRAIIMTALRLSSCGEYVLRVSHSQVARRTTHVLCDIPMDKDISGLATHNSCLGDSGVGTPYPKDLGSLSRVMLREELSSAPTHLVLAHAASQEWEAPTPGSFFHISLAQAALRSNSSF